MRILIITFLAFAVIGAGVLTQTDVQLTYFKVEKESNDLLVSWEADIEQEVREYEVQRMTRFTNNRFLKVKTIVPHGTAKPYLFRDDQVFKVGDEQVDYRLEVIYTNGVREQLARQSVNYTSTAIRRTWGSIKAMFQ